MHQVEIESFISFSLNFIPITFPPTALLRLAQGLFYGMCCSCTIGKLVWCTLHFIRKCYWGWVLSLLLYAHLHYVVISNRGGLEGGLKVKKLVSWAISTTQPILLSACQLLRVETVIQCVSVCSFTQWQPLHHLFPEWTLAKEVRELVIVIDQGLGTVLSLNRTISVRQKLEKQHLLQVIVELTIPQLLSDLYWIFFFTEHYLSWG